MNISLLLGSIRAERRSERPASFLRHQLEAAGHTVQWLDLRELALPLFDDSDMTTHPGVQKLLSGITTSDATLIVSPEYNHTYSSALKNALDYLRQREFLHRPVGLVGVSDGLVGGARALFSLRATLPTLGAVIVPTVVAIPLVLETFPTAESCTNEKVISQLGTLIHELETYAPALAQVRAALA